MSENTLDSVIEDVFSYGSALSVIKLNERNLSSHLAQGLISTDYQGRESKWTSYDCVCFTVLPEGMDAGDRVDRVLKGEWNDFFTDMVYPPKMSNEEEGTVPSAVIADFELISKCKNVRLVKANGGLPSKNFPTYVPGIDQESFEIFVDGPNRGFPAEVRVYLEDAKVTPPDSSLTGITQNAWKGLMFRQEDLPVVSDWFRRSDSSNLHVRNLPVYNEGLTYLGTTQNLFKRS